MKNWILALAILVIPVVTYFTMDKLQVNNAAFEARANTGKPVVIKFYSTMCLDCKKLEAVVKEVMPQYEEKISYKNIDAQKSNPETEALIEKYNVSLVPTMVFLKKDGEIYKRTEGYMSKSQLESALNGLLKQ